MESVKDLFRGIVGKNFDTDQALRDVDYGDRAQELLDNEMLQKALSDIREQIKEEMVSIPVSNTEGLVRLRYVARAHEMFESYLTNMIENGKVSKNLLSEYK